VHHSRLAGFIIDCQVPDLARAAEFWGAALGMSIRPLPGREGARYVQLLGGDHGLHVEVQSVRHDSRVHLDIETDNVAAEVARLETLGARRVARVESWWVMEAPTGHRFCVVPQDSPGFEQRATRWETDAQRGD
jgi:predicted enzyme related to lactoylglutathione lyase